MNYKESIKLLTSSDKFKINYGLENIRAVLKILNNPQENLKIIHVAGTNGKGSVCAMLANILKCSGYKTGLYTSPHFLEYNDRIQINSIPIEKDEFSKLTGEINFAAKKNNIELTEFELLTAAAFKYFSDNNVDIALIETGLGGRLDATNVCTSPLCSIITSISLEHTDILGDTIEKIAFEKAGIIKKNSVVITSKKNKGYDVIKNQAENLRVKLINAVDNVEIKFENGINYAIYNNQAYEFSLLGLYQKYNLQLVLAAVDFLREKGYKINLIEGLKNVKWRGRLEYIKEKNLLIDGAHNPDGAKELRKSLDYYFKDEKRIFIYGTLKTKDYKSISKILFRAEDEIYYFEFNHKNALSYDEYKNNIELDVKKYIPENKEGLKIVTGSLYMISEFMQQGYPV